MATLMWSCNGNQSAVEQNNPLLVEWDTPFGVPPFDKIAYTDYMPAFEQSMKMHDDEIRQITDNTSRADFNNTILPFDNSGEALERVSTIFSLLCSADVTPEMLQIKEQMAPLRSAHSDGIMMNEELFKRIRAVYDNRFNGRLDSMQIRLTEKIYDRFVRSGAKLTPQQKERLAQINSELSTKSVAFGRNLLAENKEFCIILDQSDLSGLPANIRTAAGLAAEQRGVEGEKWLFTTSKPSMLPFLTYSDRRDLREQLYKGYLEKCNHDDETDNKQVVNDIIRLRTLRANLLGFDSHADYVLDNVMAKSANQVYALLDEIWVPALNRAKEELAEMKQIKKSETGSDDFQPWDWWYYAEKVRKQKYNLDQEVLRPYFALNNVQQGIFRLSNRLYGLTFRPVSAPVYNDECSVFEVLDVDNTHLGVLYLDFFPRDGKKSGAWCGTYRSQSYSDGKRVPPVVTIVCNFTRPNGSDPALLTMDEVETFFHEFGHALHSLMKNVPYKGLLGVERDFVELPSQIMENWAVEPELLRSYAIHYQTGQVISDNLIEKIRRSTHFNQGFITTELAAAALSDMDIHTIKEYQPIDVNAFESEALNGRRGLIPEIAPRYRYPYFSHIFDGGYAAGYYSYLWAEVLDKDAFNAFVESGDVFNKKVAASFRNNILSKGGMADGMDLYRAFRGQEPSRRPLLVARGLVAEDEETVK